MQGQDFGIDKWSVWGRDLHHRRMKDSMPEEKLSPSAYWGTYPVCI